MRGTTIAAVAAGLSLFGAYAYAQVASDSPHIVAALKDAARPKADSDRDALRMPAAMLAYGQVKPGMTIAELIPGGGYFTRIFSKAVGPSGKVYAVINPPAPGRGGGPPPVPAVRTIAADPNYRNVEVIEPVATFKVPRPVDLVWTSQNYHDVPEAGRAQLNKSVLDALKPGGIYIVLDHSAVPGTPFVASQHRIDKAIVRREVEAAGFTFVNESTVLSNPGDDRTKAVFDGAVRGDTDQFILKFRKGR